MKELRDVRDAPGRPVTAGELRALRAYIEDESVKKAAHRLGVREQTIKNTLQNVRSKLGVSTTAKAAFLLHDRLMDEAA